MDDWTKMRKRIFTREEIRKADHDVDVKGACIKMTRKHRKAKDPFYSEANMNRLKKIMDDIRSGKASFHTHSLADITTPGNGGENNV